jgi:hypothetical protein
MEKFRNETGALMIEASLIMPLVLCTVMALIYLALFNMQEYLMMYEAQRVAAVVAREEAYIGYETLGMGADQQIDFSWGEGNYPSEEEITAYYEAHNEKASEMYREIGGLIHIFTGSGSRENAYEAKFADAARSASLLALGTISDPDVSIDYGFLGTEVTVTITHSLPTPGVLRYLGFSDGLTLKETAYTYSGSPSGFVRNVDLAIDLTAYIFEKLGMTDQYQGFLTKTKNVLGKIL